MRLLARKRPEPGQDVAVEEELAARIELLTAEAAECVGGR